MHSLEKSQALQLTDCKCSRQVANLKSGGEEGLHFGQSIFWRRGGVGAGANDYSWGSEGDRWLKGGQGREQIRESSEGTLSQSVKVSFGMTTVLSFDS